MWRRRSEGYAESVLPPLYERLCERLLRRLLWLLLRRHARRLRRTLDVQMATLRDARLIVEESFEKSGNPLAGVWEV